MEPVYESYSVQATALFSSSGKMNERTIELKLELELEKDIDVEAVMEIEMVEMEAEVEVSSSQTYQHHIVFIPQKTLCLFISPLPSSVPLLHTLMCTA